LLSFSFSTRWAANRPRDPGSPPCCGGAYPVARLGIHSFVSGSKWLYAKNLFPMRVSAKNRVGHVSASLRLGRSSERINPLYDWRQPISRWVKRFEIRRFLPPKGG